MQKNVQQCVCRVCTNIETKANIGLIFSRDVGGKCNERYIAQQHNNNHQWINFSKYLYSMFRKIKNLYLLVLKSQTNNCFGVVLSLTANAADSVQRDRYNMICISFECRVSCDYTIQYCCFKREQWSKSHPFLLQRCH